MELESSRERAFQIIREVSFPSLPLHLKAIQSEMNQQHPSFPRISEAILSDINLSAKLLKRVNSAASGLRKRIESIPQALSLLGLDTFYTAILSISIRDLLASRHLTKESFEIFWKHAQLQSVRAESLAGEINRLQNDRRIDPNQAALTGLFADCGIPIMAARYADYEPLVMSGHLRGESLQKIEEREWLTDHSIVSSMAASQWLLPSAVVAAIQSHHSPELIWYPTEASRSLSVLVRFVQSFIEVKAHPFTATTITLPVAQELLMAQFSLSNEEYEDLLSRWPKP